MRNTYRKTPTLVAALLTVLAATGCGGTDYFDNDSSRDTMSREQQFSELMKRPSIDAAVARYSEMLTEIRQGLTDSTGIKDWEEGTGGHPSPGCNDFREVDAWDAQNVYMNIWDTPTNIPDADWAKAAQTVAEISAKYGFNKMGLAVNKNPFHTAAILDGYRAEISLTTETKTLLSVTTGCHLSTEAKQRGTPRPSTQR